MCKQRTSEIDSLIKHELYYVASLDSIRELKFDSLIIASGAEPRLSNGNSF